jgi:hypothetical protein
MKKINIYLFVICIIFSACSNRKKYTSLTFENDFESVKGWLKELITDIVHSGKYSIYTDTLTRFSKAFKTTFDEITHKLLYL